MYRFSLKIDATHNYKVFGINKIIESNEGLNILFSSNSEFFIVRYHRYYLTCEIYHVGINGTRILNNSNTNRIIAIHESSIHYLQDFFPRTSEKIVITTIDGQFIAKNDKQTINAFLA